MATVSRFPKAALAIVSLPGVESLEREGDLWCCHLFWGWTTEALGGGGTVIDSNLATIRAHVKGAYQLPPVPAPVGASPILPGETAAPAAPAPLAQPLPSPSGSPSISPSPSKGQPCRLALLPGSRPPRTYQQTLVAYCSGSNLIWTPF